MGAVQSTQPEETPPPPPPPPPAPSRGWFDWVPGSKARKEAAERRRQEEERLRQEEEERQRRAEFDIIELARKQLEKGVDAARDIDTTDIVEAIKRHTDNAKEKIDEALRNNEENIRAATDLETYLPREYAEEMRHLRHRIQTELRNAQSTVDKSLPAVHVGETTVSPSTATLVFAAGLVSIYAIYKGRRFRTAADIPNSYFEKGRKIRGVVKAVNDGDNIRIRHTTWLRRSPHLPPGKLSASTVHIRLAGIDAPERAHFGSTAQPFSDEAMEYLRSIALDQKVTVQLLAKDQYQRAVAMAWVHWGPFGLLRSQLSLKLVKAGLAEVYTAGGKVYGSEANLRRLEKAEALAREQKLGMWIQGDDYVRPGDHKAAFKNGSS